MAEENTLNIAITGSSGLVGTSIIDRFKKMDHSIVRIVRPKAKIKGEDPFIIWNIDTNRIDLESLEGVDIVINLAGANIASSRWSSGYKEQIRTSRVRGTEILSHALARLKVPPKLFLSASAVGYYGINPRSVALDESHAPGTDFLSKVCVDWEAATQPAVDAGIRTIQMRFGTILSTQAGALAKMLPAFKLGLGGKLGHGDQMMSWVSVEEIAEAILFFINNENISGPVNLVSPQPVSNAEFTETLNRVLDKRTFFPVPPAVLKLAFGEMAQTLLLGGQKVVPKKLTESGYHFLYHSLESALNDLLY